MQLCMHFKLTFALKSSSGFPWQHNDLNVQLNKSTERSLLGRLYLPFRSKFPSSCLWLLRPSWKFSPFTHDGAKTYVAKEDCFCLFSLIFFLPKFHMEKITLIKPTWSSGKASVIPLMCLHKGAHSSHPASVTEGKNWASLQPTPLGESTWR